MCFFDKSAPALTATFSIFSNALLLYRKLALKSFLLNTFPQLSLIQFFRFFVTLSTTLANAILQDLLVLEDIGGAKNEQLSRRWRWIIYLDRIQAPLLSLYTVKKVG